MATTTKTEAAKAKTAEETTVDGDKPANIPAATEFEASGAPQQVVPDVDPKHPAVDDNPRAGTTVDQNRIDFNDPGLSSAEAVQRNLEAQSKG